MQSEMSVSFPHMGSYGTVICQLLKHLFPRAVVFEAPPITNRTIELGAKHSPDFVCCPFKYNLGNFIEALDLGANVLFQTGMGCRYGYYGELQELILRDMGYSFKFVCLSRERANVSALYSTFRELGCALPLRDIAHALFIAGYSIKIIDEFEYFMRENIGFQEKNGSLENIHKILLKGIGKSDGINDLKRIKAHCRDMLMGLRICRPENPIKIGVVGDLFTLMEPFSNFYLEKLLAQYGISVSRIMNLCYLLVLRSDRRLLKDTSGYLGYTVGANGVDSVAYSKKFFDRGYDGIIHIKSFGCIPELNATPALKLISEDYRMPILHLSFDSHTSETGVQTRIEAFSDMVAMRKEMIK